jgi:hypothetical protein
MEKESRLFILGAWKGKLEKIKGFVDRALACILEGPGGVWAVFESQYPLSLLGARKG